MGFFDNLYIGHNANFGGTGGGLLDLLRTTQMQNDQYQPSQGFGPTPTDQAQPIGVGDYQMPRIGNPQAFTPDPAAIPQNAQPTQGQLPAPQAPQAAPATQPAFLQSPNGGAGLGGAFRGMAANAHTGPIGALLGGAMGAMGMGQGSDQDVARQNLKAQYDALLPTLGPNKAMLAVMNPEAGKILIAQALEKHQYGFTTLPDGTIVRQDPRTGTVEPAYQTTPKADFGVINEADGQKTYGWIDKNKRETAAVPGTEPRATSITGPDGKPIPIPEGVDRKTFVNEVSRAGAKAAAGEKTEVQAKSEKFGNKMENAERNLKTVESEGQSYKGRSLEGAPLIGDTMATNWLQSDGYQKYKQARDNFITALLRDESGAAIGTAEFKRYEKELFPQPGEGAAVIEQKREARKIAIEAMKKSAGPGYKSPVFDTPAGNAPSGVDPKVWGVMTAEERALWK